MSLSNPTSHTKYILTGSLRDCARWAAKRDLRLSEWAHSEPSIPFGIGEPVRVYALVEDDSQLPAPME